MAKYLQVVALNCTEPEKEGEFNEWYNNIHLPDILETPGFQRATRWENTNPGEGDAKYLALYEIETEDIESTMKALLDNLAVKREAGRTSDLLGPRVLRGTYRQIISI